MGRREKALTQKAYGTDSTERIKKAPIKRCFVFVVGYIICVSF